MGKHWQDGFLFVWEDAFGMAEGIVLKHFKDYDHFEMNDIPKNVGKLITVDWKKAASTLESDALKSSPPLRYIKAPSEDGLCISPAQMAPPTAPSPSVGRNAILVPIISCAASSASRTFE